MKSEKGPFSIKIEDDVREEIERLVKSRKYLTPSEFVKRAIYEKLDREHENENLSNKFENKGETTLSKEIQEMIKEIVTKELDQRSN